MFKIPYIENSKDQLNILEYHRLYKSVSNIWINSLSDRFSKRQLTSYKSNLNQWGVEICKELEEKLGKPVYFLLNNPIGSYYQPKKNNKNLKVCPKFKGKFRWIKDGYADKVCDKCKYAFFHFDEDES